MDHCIEWFGMCSAVGWRHWTAQLDVGPESITQCVSIIVFNLRWKLEVTCFFPKQNLKTLRHVSECLCNRWSKIKPRYWIRRGKPPSAIAKLTFERQSAMVATLILHISPYLSQNQGANSMPSLCITGAHCTQSWHSILGRGSRRVEAKWCERRNMICHDM